MGFITSAVVFVAFPGADKCGYKYAVFGHITTISVHRKAMLSMDFLFYSESLPRPFGVGGNRDHVKNEESYEQVNDDQTDVIAIT